MSQVGELHVNAPKEGDVYAWVADYDGESVPGYYLWNKYKGYDPLYLHIRKKNNSRWFRLLVIVPEPNKTIFQARQLYILQKKPNSRKLHFVNYKKYLMDICPPK